MPLRGRPEGLSDQKGLLESGARSLGRLVLLFGDFFPVELQPAPARQTASNVTPNDRMMEPLADDTVTRCEGVIVSP